MNYFEVAGQCTAHISGKLIDIGFKNIASIKRTKEQVNLYCKNGDIYTVKVEKFKSKK